jgi:hypothetical protein
MEGERAMRTRSTRWGWAFTGCAFVACGPAEGTGALDAGNSVDGGLDAAQDAGFAGEGGGDVVVAEGDADATSPPDGTTTNDAADDQGDGSALDGPTQDGHSEDGPPADGPTQDSGGRVCLPDGSGFLRFRTSGALSLDIQLGNADSCDGVWSQQGLTITYFVPLPVSDAGSNPTGILDLTVDGIAPGTTASAKTANFSLVGGLGIFDSPTPTADGGVGIPACSVDITLAQPIGSGSRYKVMGSVHCNAPIPSAFAGRPALSVNQFDFAILVAM